MKPKDFDAVLARITTKGKLSVAKAKALSSDLRNQMTQQLIKLRQPVVACLLPDDIDQSWLNSMGYMYQTASPTNGLVFRHTAEHVIA